MKYIGLVMLVTMVAGAGCKKARFTNRLVNTWQVDRFIRHGVDSTTEFHQIFEDYEITFFEDNDFHEYYVGWGLVPVTIHGTWNFNDSETQITLVDSSQTRKYNIDHLKKDDLQVSNAIERIELTPQ